MLTSVRRNGLISASDFRSESGFTLLELLVVTLIIAALVSIAVPAFLTQREKGQDVCAKAQIRTALTAAEAYLVENQTYVGLTPAGMNLIEPQVPDVASGGSNCPGATDFAVGLATVAPDGTGDCVAAATAADNYCIGLTSGSGRKFALHRLASGLILHNCGERAASTAGGGCKAGSW